MENTLVEKYDSAAIRHFEDARLLKDAGKKDNAGHLVGFAAECAIKHQIASLKSGQPTPHGHLPDFLVIARKHINGRGRYPYSEMFNLLKSNVFSEWSVNRRYHKTGNTAESELVAWFMATKNLFVAAKIKVRQ